MANLYEKAAHRGPDKNRLTRRDVGRLATLQGIPTDGFGELVRRGSYCEPDTIFFIPLALMRRLAVPLFR